jgi:Ni,Fe-hydrogenase III component G
MAGYVVLECKDCWHKEIYPIRTADGKRCGKCGSGLFISIDAGNKKEMMLKHIPPGQENEFPLRSHRPARGTPKTEKIANANFLESKSEVGT